MSQRRTVIAQLPATTQVRTSRDLPNPYAPAFNDLETRNATDYGQVTSCERTPLRNHWLHINPRARGLFSMSPQAEYDQLLTNIDVGSKSHPEDMIKDDKSSDSFSDHDGTTLHSSDERSTTASDNPTIMPTSTYLSTTTQFDANTGPKGVIADARSFETAKKRSFRQTLYAFTDGASTPFKKLNTYREKSKSPTPDSSADDDEDGEDNDDDRFMRTWRQKRLDELSRTTQEIKTRRQSPSKRRYGSLVTVDPAGYLDAVEKVGADTVVVVLIYDDEVCPLSHPFFECSADPALGAVQNKYQSRKRA